MTIIDYRDNPFYNSEDPILTEYRQMCSDRIKENHLGIIDSMAFASIPKEWKNGIRLAHIDDLEFLLNSEKGKNLDQITIKNYLEIPYYYLISMASRSVLGTDKTVDRFIPDIEFFYLVEWYENFFRDFNNSEEIKRYEISTDGSMAGAIEVKRKQDFFWVEVQSGRWKINGLNGLNQFVIKNILVRVVEDASKTGYDLIYFEKEPSIDEKLLAYLGFNKAYHSVKKDIVFAKGEMKEFVKIPVIPSI